VTPVRTIDERPEPATRPHVDALVEELPHHERIPRRSGDVAFDHAWEIRAFSLAVALHEKGGFPWPDFQRELTDVIRDWEAEHPGTAGWSYYERWTAALERLAGRLGWLTREELDARTGEILALPPNANHQHAVREPVAVSAPRGDGR
jgi:nitrile hydratase accessory protein